MITPLDIQNKEFKKSLGGYRTKDVDGYLDYINTDYEKLYKENIELKDKIGMLTDQIRQYNNLEETLKSTLVIAQSTADEVTNTARKKADLILEEAELDANNLIKEAEEKVKNIKREYEDLKKEMFIFKSRYENFMQAQLTTVQDFYNDFEEKNELKKSKDKTSIEDSSEEVDILNDVDNLGA